MPLGTTNSKSMHHAGCVINTKWCRSLIGKLKKRTKRKILTCVEGYY